MMTTVQGWQEESFVRVYPFVDERGGESLL
jgi:hypothetical protein